MKKAIAKLLKKSAEESLEFPDKKSVKQRYKKFKKSWKNNVKHGKSTS